MGKMKKEKKNNKTYCYIRVSTDKQDFKRQEFILQNNGYIDGVNCIYVEETGSGKDLKRRPVLTNLIENVLEQGDTLIATDMTRISRSIIDLRKIVDNLLITKKVDFVLLKENFYFYANERMDAMTKGMYNMLAVISEMERDLISDRTREKMAWVKENGTKSGKPIGKPLGKYSTYENFLETLRNCINGMSIRQSCNTTFYPLGTFTYNIKKYKEQLNTNSYEDLLFAFENNLIEFKA